jgi:hypothetical protein
LIQEPGVVGLQCGVSEDLFGIIEVFLLEAPGPLEARFRVHRVADRQSPMGSFPRQPKRGLYDRVAAADLDG